MPGRELDMDFLKTVTILYVEDNADTCEQLGQFLSRRAGRLVTASSGLEGLEKFIEQKPRIVVTDILMPDMDGLEMAGKIRELDRKVPIIVTTAFEQTDYMRRSIDIGVDKYVVKPVDCDRLQEALLDCAHRLRAESLLNQARKLEAESLRINHLESLHLLAGGMAHDFNNLLQSILGYVYLAKAEAEPGSEVRKFLRMAEDCSVQARELGERLLLVANADKPARSNAPLGEIVKAVVSRMVDGTGVAVELGIPDGIPEISCADSQIRELLIQLTRNAIEAMPDGGRLRISVLPCRLEDDDLPPLPKGDYLRLEIADTGHGIAPDCLPKIFVPYFSTRNIGIQKGMGLGLALCDTIVRRHNGLIRAESVTGEGAVFHVWLPIAGGAAVAGSTEPVL